MVTALPVTQPDRKDTQKGDFLKDGQPSWFRLANEEVDTGKGDIPEQSGPQSFAEVSNAVFPQQVIGHLGGHGLRPWDLY